MKPGAVWLFAAASLVLLACGGEDEAGDAAERNCLSIADAFARAWERCGRASYEQTYDAFSSELKCEEAGGYDSAAVEQCVSDIDALTCAEVGSGSSPKSCANLED